MSRDRAAIVLQARMASTRLPGKALSAIGGLSVLGHCVLRLRSRDVAPVVVATTTNDEDDCLAEEAIRHGALVVRGPSSNVLARFLLAADLFDLDCVIRATADNPAVDLDAPARVLAVLRERRADHVIDRDLPYGAAVEAVRVDALRRASARTRSAADREHVTRFLHRHPSEFRLRRIAAPPALCRPDLRLTIDTPADLVYLRRVFAAVPTTASPAPLTDIIMAADVLARRAEAA
jgi:spore coat polysaccharide biosynthesis protein SpsF